MKTRNLAKQFEQGLVILRTTGDPLWTRQYWMARFGTAWVQNLIRAQGKLNALYGRPIAYPLDLP